MHFSVVLGSVKVSSVHLNENLQVEFRPALIPSMDLQFSIEVLPH